MTLDYPRTLLAHYYRLHKERGSLFISEGKYGVEALLLVNYGWIRCVRIEADQTGSEPAYRVQFTRVGLREARMAERAAT